MTDYFNSLTPEQNHYHFHIRCQKQPGVCVLPAGHPDYCAMSFIGREDLIWTYEQVIEHMKNHLAK